jgi:hypothetical protein
MSHDVPEGCQPSKPELKRCFFPPKKILLERFYAENGTCKPCWVWRVDPKPVAWKSFQFVHKTTKRYDKHSRPIKATNVKKIRSRLWPSAASRGSWLLSMVLCIWYCALSTVHCVLCTVYCELRTMHCVVCTVYCALHTVDCALCAVHCALCTVHSELCTVHCVLCTVYHALCTVNCTPCTVHCILYTVYCILCTVHCIPCTVYCAVSICGVGPH